MTKRRLSEVEVVEIDAIDLGDWERNMSTSEVPAAHLARMVRQTKSGQATVVEKPQPAPRSAAVRPQPSPDPVPRPRPTSPDVAASARPSVAPSTITPVSEALPAPVERESARLRARFASPRVLLLMGGAVAAVTLVVLLAVHGSGSTSTAEPLVASSAPTNPSPSAAPNPSPSVASTSKSPAAAPVARAVDATTPTPPTHAIAVDVHPASSKTDVPAPAKTATKHHSHSAHHHATRKTVAARSAPRAETSVDTGTVDRAREAYNAGNEALFSGNSDDAIRSYKEAIEVSPSLAFGHRGLGLAYAQKGDNAAAVAAFREYLRLAPHAKDSVLIRKRISGLQTAHH